MNFFKTNLKPSITPDKTIQIAERNRFQNRTSRYQEYQSIQLDSSLMRPEELHSQKGYSLSLKAQGNISTSSRTRQQMMTSRYQGSINRNSQNESSTQNTSLESGPQRNRWFEQHPQNRQKAIEPAITNLRTTRRPSFKAQQNPSVSSREPWYISDKIENQSTRDNNIQQSTTSNGVDENSGELNRVKKMIKSADYLNAVKVLQQLDMSSIECQYLMGVVLYYLGQIEQAVGFLENVLKMNQKYKKEIYIYISQCYSGLQKYDISQYYLEKCVKIYPDYYDALFHSAIVSIRQKNYSLALNYLNITIDKDSLKPQAYLLRADCYMKQKNFQKALMEYKDIYNQFEILRDQPNFQLKFYYALLKSHEIDKALENINKFIEKNHEITEAFYMKGKILQKLKRFEESCISFEQVIYLNTSKRMCAKSVYQIGKLKIEQKDFYSAQHHLKRFDYYKQPQFTFFNKLRGFVEGVICLMKRKFAKALEFFITLQKLIGVSKFLQPFFHLYKAYGHFCINEYQQCIDEYKTITSSGIALNLGALYNLEICDALLAAKKCTFFVKKQTQDNYETAFEKLINANKLIPQRMEPYFYRACILIQRVSSRSQQQKRLVVQEAQAEIKLAFEAQGKSANLYYVRALLKSYFHRFTSAIKDLDKAIDKSEDNVIEHFYLRGVLLAQQMRLEQAIKDFSTCIHFDKDFSEGYIERAKCYQIIGKQEKAFADLKKYIQLRSEDLVVHFWAASLLFHNNAYEEALKAYQECVQSKDVQILIIKCHLKKQDIDKAHECFNQLMKSHSGDPKAKIDAEMVSIIRNVIQLNQPRSKQKNEANFRDFATVILNNNDLLEKLGNSLRSPQIGEQFGFIFSRQDFQHQKAIMMFFNKNYQQCHKELTLIDEYWQEKHNQRKNQQTQQYQILNTEESEQIQNEMILKSERIIQHIIAIKYNIIINHLIQSQYREAIKQCEKIKELIGDVVSDEINYLQESAQAQLDGKSIQRFGKVMTFLMNEHSLFNLYPTVKLTFKGGIILECKLSISFPDIQPPNICPTFQDSMIDTITPALVENKPEAPWIKREHQTIVFTDNIFLGDNLRLKTEDEEEKPVKTDKKEVLKQALKLDENVQNKLNKFIKGKTEKTE